MTAFSFYATKPLVTGEGGMLTTDTESYAERIRMTRLHGISRDACKRKTTEGSWYYEVVAPGYKYNLTDPAAAMGISQLSRLDQIRNMREQIATAYLAGINQNLCELPASRKISVHAWHLFVFKISESAAVNRKELISGLADDGIGCSVHFLPLNLHPFYQQSFGYKKGMFPVSEAAYNHIVSLPIWPGMTAEIIDYVVDRVNLRLSGNS